MHRKQIYLEHEDRDTGAWRAQWREALEKSFGIAPYLGGGSEYVEDIRRADAERLSRFAPPPRAG
jgi:hypothetical protein